MARCAPYEHLDGLQLDEACQMRQRWIVSCLTDLNDVLGHIWGEIRRHLIQIFDRRVLQVVLVAEVQHCLCKC